MKKSSENAGNTVINATTEEQKPSMSQRGLTVRDGLKNTAMVIPAQPLTVLDLRTTHSEIELMKHRSLLTISAEVKSISVPKRDYDGIVYAWESQIVETGEYSVTVSDIGEEGRQIILNTIVPGSKKGIHSALEHLAQIKPIGRSEIKQKTVISYLSFDLFDEGASEFVVNEVCKDYRKSHESDFFPNSAEFLEKCRNAMKKYKAVLDKIDGVTEEIKALPKPEDKFTPDSEEKKAEVAKMIKDSLRKI